MTDNYYMLSAGKIHQEILEKHKSGNQERLHLDIWELIIIKLNQDCTDLITTSS